ncbi:MAG TPA: peptidylprolyl isomerase [Microlunatus sp.]|nr:peptidylprolyl isomerase [Microlunatus sp.]
MRRHTLVRAGLGPAAAALLTVFAACGTTPTVDPLAATRPSASAASTAVETGPKDCEYVATGDAARPVKPPTETGVPRSGTTRYVMTTNEGPVTLTLHPSKAPCAVHSFTSLADQGFFDQTRCPRLANKGLFILQCGDPTGTTDGGPGYTFADETTGNEQYKAGVVAMANSGPNTNGSQFFIVFADSELQPDYTIFATIDATSLKVVKRIVADGDDGSNPYGGGKPKNPAEIISVKKQS